MAGRRSRHHWPTPTKDTPDARYGAHVWLKLPESPGLGEPPMPEDAYYMLGYDEQVWRSYPRAIWSSSAWDLRVKKAPGTMPRDLAPIVRAFPPRLPGA
jgi:hypothetical protein